MEEKIKKLLVSKGLSGELGLIKGSGEMEAVNGLSPFHQFPLLPQISREGFWYPLADLSQHIAHEPSYKSGFKALGRGIKGNYSAGCLQFARPIKYLVFRMEYLKSPPVKANLARSNEIVADLEKLVELGKI